MARFLPGRKRKAPRPMPTTNPRTSTTLARAERRQIDLEAVLEAVVLRERELIGDPSREAAWVAGRTANVPRLEYANRRRELKDHNYLRPWKLPSPQRSARPLGVAANVADVRAQARRQLPSRELNMASAGRGSNHLNRMRGVPHDPRIAPVPPCL